MPTEAFINGDILIWARERANVSSDALAKSLHVSTDELAQWELGAKRPSFRKAQDAAARLKVPFGYLFLSKRPEDRLQLPDLRTPNDEMPEQASVELLDIVEDAQRKQAWYREYRSATDAEPLSFVGRFAGSDATPNEIAHDIRTTLGIDTDFRREAKSWADFLLRLTRRLEETGILVFRAGQVGSNTRRLLDPKEFKGFVISDPMAPVILVNARDWKASQVFTIGHELGHMWVGESGVSNPDLSVPDPSPGNTTERRCNQIAAEVLVPGDDLATRWDATKSVAGNVSALAAWYRVSELVVLRRAHDRSVVSATQYREDYKRQWQEWQERASGDQTDDDDEHKKTGGNFWNSFFARNSTRFTFDLVDSVAGGYTSVSEAASLLGLKRTTFEAQFAVSSA
ncbi:MAG: XRE family transcriptional regulator [Dehalococcoidia bacterium]